MTDSRRRRFRAASLLLSLALAACGGGAATTSKDTLVMARVKDSENLDSSHAVEGNSLNVTSEVMQGLVRFKPGTFDVEGALAKSWTVSPDGKTYTFMLVPGVKFSDGTPVDAAAVKFNFDRWRLKSDPSHGNFAYTFYSDQFGGFPGVIGDVIVVSPTQVRMKLTRSLGPFMRNLAMPSFAIGSPKAIISDPKGFEQKPVGSGPYTVVEWIKDDHMTLAANPTYSPQPAYKNVIVRAIPDQATSVLSLQKGDIDMLTEPRPDDARSVASDKSITVAEQPANNLSYLAMNLEKKPFDNLLVRQAIAYALDLPSIAGKLYGPGTTVADNWVPKGMLGETSAVKAYAFNVAKAKALLAQAGFPKGFATNMYYPTTPRPYMPEPQRLAETLQAELKTVGIDVTLQPYEFGVFLEKVRNGEHQMCLIGWSGDNGDPDNFMYVLLDEDSAHKGTAQNYSFWRDPAFHKLMLAGQAEADQAKRAVIYQKAVTMVHDQIPAIPLIHRSVPILIKSSIAGFVPSPDTQYHWELMKPKS